MSNNRESQQKDLKAIEKVPLDDANMESMLYVNGECK